MGLGGKDIHRTDSTNRNVLIFSRLQTAPADGPAALSFLPPCFSNISGFVSRVFFVRVLRLLHWALLLLFWILRFSLLSSFVVRRFGSLLLVCGDFLAQQLSL